MKLESPEGFIVHYTTLVEGKLASTAFPLARTAEIIEHRTGNGAYSDTKRFWQIRDGVDKFLGNIPENYVLAILKLETVGPADANKPQ